MVFEFRKRDTTLRLFKDGRVTYYADGRKTTFNTSQINELTYYFTDGTRTKLCMEALTAACSSPDSAQLWLLILKGEDLLERNNNHTETRRHVPYSDKNDKWDTLTDIKINIEEEIIKKADKHALKSAISTLLPQQQKLLKKVYIQGIPITHIADLEGVSKSAISHRLKKIYKRLKRELTK